MSSVVRSPLVGHFVPLGPERHGRASVPSGAHPPVLDAEVAQDLRPELVVDPHRARRSAPGAPASTSSHRRAPPLPTDELADRTRTEVAVLRSGRFRLPCRGAYLRLRPSFLRRQALHGPQRLLEVLVLFRCHADIAARSQAPVVCFDLGAIHQLHQLFDIAQPRIGEALPQPVGPTDEIARPTGPFDGQRPRVFERLARLANQDYFTLACGRKPIGILRYPPRGREFTDVLPSPSGRGALPASSGE